MLDMIFGRLLRNGGNGLRTEIWILGIYSKFRSESNGDGPGPQNPFFFVGRKSYINSRYTTRGGSYVMMLDIGHQESIAGMTSITHGAHLSMQVVMHASTGSIVKQQSQLELPVINTWENY